MLYALKKGKKNYWINVLSVNVFVTKSIKTNMKLESDLFWHLKKYKKQVVSKFKHKQEFKLWNCLSEFLKFTFWFNLHTKTLTCQLQSSTFASSLLIKDTNKTEVENLTKHEYQDVKLLPEKKVTNGLPSKAPVVLRLSS